MVNGVLQELHIRCGDATPYYLDNTATLFVANDDAAAKKSVWLARRLTVLHEGVSCNEIEPIHIGESEMVADPFTKYLPYAVWVKHMNYLLNCGDSYK